MKSNSARFQHHVSSQAGHRIFRPLEVSFSQPHENWRATNQKMVISMTLKLKYLKWQTLWLELPMEAFAGGPFWTQSQVEARRGSALVQLPPGFDSTDLLVPTLILV